MENRSLTTSLASSNEIKCKPFDDAIRCVGIYIDVMNSNSRNEIAESLKNIRLSTWSLYFDPFIPIPRERVFLIEANYTLLQSKTEYILANNFKSPESADDTFGAAAGELLDSIEKGKEEVLLMGSFQWDLPGFYELPKGTKVLSIVGWIIVLLVALAFFVPLNVAPLNGKQFIVPSILVFLMVSPAVLGYLGLHRIVSIFPFVAVVCNALLALDVYLLADYDKDEKLWRFFVLLIIASIIASMLHWVPRTVSFVLFFLTYVILEVVIRKAGLTEAIQFAGTYGIIAVSTSIIGHHTHNGNSIPQAATENIRKLLFRKGDRGESETTTSDTTHVVELDVMSVDLRSTAGAASALPTTCRFAACVEMTDQKKSVEHPVLLAHMENVFSHFIALAVNFETLKHVSPEFAEFVTADCNVNEINVLATFGPVGEGGHVARLPKKLGQIVTLRSKLNDNVVKCQLLALPTSSELLQAEVAFYVFSPEISTIYRYAARIKGSLENMLLSQNPALEALRGDLQSLIAVLNFREGAGTMEVDFQQILLSVCGEHDVMCECERDSQHKTIVHANRAKVMEFYRAMVSKIPGETITVLIQQNQSDLIVVSHRNQHLAQVFYEDSTAFSLVLSSSLDKSPGRALVSMGIEGGFDVKVDHLGVTATFNSRLPAVASSTIQQVLPLCHRNFGRETALVIHPNHVIVSALITLLWQNGIAVCYRERIPTDLERYRYSAVFISVITLTEGKEKFDAARFPGALIVCMTSSPERLSARDICRGDSHLVINTVLSTNPIELPMQLGDVVKEIVHRTPLLAPARFPTSFEQSDFFVLNKLGGGQGGRALCLLSKSDYSMCAVKQYIKSALRNQESKVLESEMMKIGRRHPNIVENFRVIDEQHEIVVYMELCSPLSLLDKLSNKAVSCYFASGVTSEILQGLYFLHRNGLFAGDLKAGNVLFGAGLVAKLADYNSLFSTPCWVAPELSKPGAVMKSSPAERARADIWALGCMQLEMMYGKRHVPFNEHHNVNDYLMRCFTGEVDFIVKIPLQIDPTWAAFTRECLTVDPQHRPTAEALMSNSFLKLRDVVVDHRSTATPITVGNDSLVASSPCSSFHDWLK